MSHVGLIRLCCEITPKNRGNIARLGQVWVNYVALGDRPLRIDFRYTPIATEVARRPNMPRWAISDVTLFSARVSLTYYCREPPAGGAEIPPINGGLCAHGGA